MSLTLSFNVVPATVRRYFKGPEFIAVSLWRGKAAKPEEIISFTREMAPTYDILKKRLYTLFKPHNESNFHIHIYGARKCHGHGEISPQVYDSLFRKSQKEAKDPARVLYAHFGFMPMCKPLINTIARPAKAAATKKPAPKMTTAAKAKIGLAWPQFGFGAPAPRKRAALEPLPMLPSPPKKRKASPPEQQLSEKEAERQRLNSHTASNKDKVSPGEQPAAKENAEDRTADAGSSLKAKIGFAWPRFCFGAPAPRKRAALEPLPTLPSPPKKRKTSSPEQPFSEKEAERQGLDAHTAPKEAKASREEQPAAKENAEDKTADAASSSTNTSSPEQPSSNTNTKGDGSNSTSPSKHAEASLQKQVSRKRRAEDEASEPPSPPKKRSFWRWLAPFATRKRNTTPPKAPEPERKVEEEQGEVEVDAEEETAQAEVDAMVDAEPEQAEVEAECSKDLPAAAAIDNSSANTTAPTAPAAPTAPTVSTAPTASTTAAAPAAATAPAATTAGTAPTAPISHWASPAQRPSQTGLIPIGWLQSSGHVICASLGRHSTVVWSRSPYNREGVKIDTHTERFELAFPALLDVEFAPEFQVMADAGTLQNDLLAALLMLKENRAAQPGIGALKFDVGVGGQSFELKKLRGNRFMVGVLDGESDGYRDHADGRKNVVSVAPRRINHPARGWIVEPIVRVEELDKDGEFLAMPERLVDVDWERELIEGEHSMWGWESIVSWDLLPELELVGKLRVGRTVGHSFRELAKMME